nr:PREDICTED: uncharacterized protein LOC109033571 [Bemisia tabaci]
MSLLTRRVSLLCCVFLAVAISASETGSRNDDDARSISLAVNPSTTGTTPGGETDQALHTRDWGDWGFLVDALHSLDDLTVNNDGVVNGDGNGSIFFSGSPTRNGRSSPGSLNLDGLVVNNNAEFNGDGNGSVILTGSPSRNGRASPGKRGSAVVNNSGTFNGNHNGSVIVGDFNVSETKVNRQPTRTDSFSKSPRRRRRAPSSTWSVVNSNIVNDSGSVTPNDDFQVWGTVNWSGQYLDVDGSGVRAIAIGAETLKISVINGKEVTVNGKKVCQDVKTLSQESTYQVMPDGSLWFTNLKVGRAMTKDEEAEFKEKVKEKEEETKAALEAAEKQREAAQAAAARQREQAARQREIALAAAARQREIALASAAKQRAAAARQREAAARQREAAARQREAASAAWEWGGPWNRSNSWNSWLWS